MNSQLQDEIMSDIAKEMQQGIDNSIMIAILLENGWYSVDIPRFLNREHSIDIMLWCEKMFPKGSYQYYGLTYMFKHKKHAEWFLLKWQ